MIKVSVFYPSEEGKKFNHGYWTTTHLNLAQSLLGPMGLVNCEMEKGVSGTNPNDPPQFIAVAHLYFNTVDEVHAAFMAHAGAIIDDMSNYTEIKPQFQISETLL